MYSTELTLRELVDELVLLMEDEVKTKKHDNFQDWEYRIKKFLQEKELVEDFD